jgi:hypothetical protein
MKTIITYLLMMTFFGGFVSAQEKKSKSKKPSARQGSVYSYKFVPRSSTGDPLIFTMPVDTTRAANVKIPNSYRKGNTKPVPMPTHKVELVRSKKMRDSSNTSYVPSAQIGYFSESVCLVLL